MPDVIPVFVYASDPISQAGMASQLRSRVELRVVEDMEVDAASVAVVVADDVDDEALRAIKALQRNGCPRVVAVITAVSQWIHSCAPYARFVHTMVSSDE